MSDEPGQYTNGTVAQLQFWKGVSGALMAFILGILLPFVVTQGSVKKDDFTNNNIQLQKQFADLVSQIGKQDQAIYELRLETQEQDGAIKQLDSDVGRLSQGHNTMHPIP